MKKMKNDQGALLTQAIEPGGQQLPSVVDPVGVMYNDRPTDICIYRAPMELKTKKKLARNREKNRNKN